MLNLHGTKVSDAGLAHFKDCKNLTQPDLGGTQVGDAGLVHFKDCKSSDTTLADRHAGGQRGAGPPQGLQEPDVLYLHGTKVTDLSPAEGDAPQRNPVRLQARAGPAILRSIKTLETINGKPAKEFWKEVDAKEP